MQRKRSLNYFIKWLAYEVGMINFTNMTKMKINFNRIKFGFKKIKLWSSYVSFPILIGVNLLVTESQFGFPDIKFDVCRFLFYLCYIEVANPLQIKLQAIVVMILNCILNIFNNYNCFQIRVLKVVKKLLNTWFYFIMLFLLQNYAYSYYHLAIWIKLFHFV